MSWFYDTFLPSLLERAGTNHAMWLTRKQTEICTRYMEKHTVRLAEFQGDYTSHDYYTVKWGERDVHLSYSKLNGCGTISFSFNKAELEAHQKEVEAEKERIEAERLERIKRNPERLQKAINKARAAYEDAVRYLEENIEDEMDEECIRLSRELVDECKAKLDKLTN